ncbi:MAG: hypothetical protein AB8G11_09625 [Saprospiraceae bacterium]
MSNKLLNAELRFISKHLKKADLDIFKFAEFISDEVINNYGKHNFNKFKNTVNERLEKANNN